MMHVMASILLATIAFAQLPFALDTTFRTVITQQYVNSMHLLPDGGIFLSGVIRFPGDMYNRGSAKLLSSGQLDQTFPTFPFTTGGGKVIPWNDRFYVSNGLVRRMTPDGLIDPSFIMMNNGPYFSSLQPGDYHVYPDGRVLISGAHILDDTARGFVGEYDLIWFSNTGYLDTTRVHRRGNGTVFNFKELPSGGFICSGSGTQFEGVNVGRIFRTDADGVPDPLFQSDVFAGYAYTYLPLADGRVYAGGRFRRSAAPMDTLLLARFMPDGSLDPSFAIPQFSLGAFPVDFGKIVSCLYPWGDGNIVVTGQFHYVNGLPRSGICMIDSTGQVLDAFDDCGVGAFQAQSNTYATVDFVMHDTTNNYLYLSGAYTGYTDGTTTDPLQRFVSRLHVGDITTSAPPLSVAEELGVRVYPNPSSGPVNVALQHLPRNTQLVLRDALGKEVHRQHITSHYTTLSVAQSGVYMVELWDSQARHAALRLIIQ